MTDRYHDYEYINLVHKILKDGVEKSDRTGTGTLSLFAQQMRFDISGGSIPMLTTKKMFTRGIIHEILWYLSGNTNIKYLTDNNVNIWNEWADENGDLGPVYGQMWRRWPSTKIISNSGGSTQHNDSTETFYNTKVQTRTVDQIAQVIYQLRNNPDDRRMVVNAWNVGLLDDMKLPPCHLLFQFWAHKGKLKCHLYQRSCDIGLGVPFNIVQYSILTHMIAHVTGHEAVEFVWTGGDCHIYNNHLDPLLEQVQNEPFKSPFLELAPNITEIDNFKFEDFKIIGYNKYWPIVKMDVSV